MKNILPFMEGCMFSARRKQQKSTDFTTTADRWNYPPENVALQASMQGE